MVISIAMVAALIKRSNAGTIEYARIAVGACSPVALRLTALEQELSGRELSPALASVVRPEHLRELCPIDDARATASYRIEVVEEMVRRVLQVVAKGE